MNKIKLIPAIVLTFGILFSCNEIQHKLKNPSEFVVVVEDTVGEQYDWAKEFCDSLKLPAVYVVNSNLSQCIEGIHKGEYDLLAKKLIITSDLREQLAFTINLSLDKLVLVQRQCKDTTCVYIDDLLKMEGKQIYVTSASPAIMRLENIQHEIGASFEIVETPHTQCDYLLEQLSAGAIDYMVSDYETVFEKLDKYSNIDIRTVIGFSQFKAWAVHKDSLQILNQLDEFLLKKKNKR